MVLRQQDQFNSVQLLSCVQLFETPWTTGRQASLSITNSRSLLKLQVRWVGDAIQPSQANYTRTIDLSDNWNLYLLTTIILFYLPNPIFGNQKSDIIFLWVWISSFDSACKCLSFSVWLISLSIIPSIEVQTHCCKWQDFPSFHGWIVFCCVCIYILPLSLHGHLGCKNHCIVYFKSVNWWYWIISQ